MSRGLICDDQAVVCEGLRVILHSAAGLEVVGVATMGSRPWNWWPRTSPTWF